MSYTAWACAQMSAHWDGAVEVALYCGDKEVADAGYKRQTAHLESGVNSDGLRFGPYARAFRHPITEVRLYLGSQIIGMVQIAGRTPDEAEVTTIAPGAIVLRVKGD